jgi:hypothetical protein
MAFDHMPARLRHFLRTSSDERHQNRPYSDQTKRHPGSSDISAHRPSPSLRRMAIAPASRCDQMMRQPRLRCRCVHLNKKKASGVPRLRVEEKDLSGNEKAGSGAGLSHHTLRCGLAVGARIAVWREEPSAVTRLGEVGVHRLPVLGLLALRLSVLRIHRRVKTAGYSGPKASGFATARWRPRWRRGAYPHPVCRRRRNSRLACPPRPASRTTFPDLAVPARPCRAAAPTVRGQPRVQSRRSHNKRR